MTKLVFATGNPHKVKEVNEMLDGQFDVVSLKDIGCEEDVPETSPTIEGNALQKARYVFEKYGVDCFSEDTGLEITALRGEPGVLSARYAGADRDPEANMQLVLEKLADRADRSGRFKTVIALDQHQVTQISRVRILQHQALQFLIVNLMEHGRVPQVFVKIC